VVLLVELANHREIVQRDGRKAGERALVVAAARLSAVVREVDTVCRVADTRFAVLAEGPQPEPARRLLGQHALDRLLQDPRRVVQHLEARGAGDSHLHAAPA
jgi:two-component system, sensor histidine kinase LadS